jgi:hypothetical protein
MVGWLFHCYLLIQILKSLPSLYGFGLQNGENRYICIKQKEIAYE